MTNAGLHCVGCQAATWETLEVGMLGHGFREEEINRLLDRLNEILQEEFESILDFSEKPTDDDEVFSSQGIEIHVNRKMLARLLGSEIDYLEGLMGSGFKVTNPNVKGSCSCGNSQSY